VECWNNGILGKNPIAVRANLAKSIIPEFHYSAKASLRAQYSKYEQAPSNMNEIAKYLWISV